MPNMQRYNFSTAAECAWSGDRRGIQAFEEPSPTQWAKTVAGLSFYQI